MNAWLKKWFGGHGSGGAASGAGRTSVPDDAERRRLENDLQSARLELSQAAARIQQLQKDLQAQRTGAASELQDRLDRQIEQWLEELAQPLSQFATQTHLLQVHEKPIRAEDTLAVAKNVLRFFEKQGLEWIGSIDTEQPFQPSHHQPLDASHSPQPGNPVIIKMPGIARNGRVLLKAAIDMATHT